MVDIKSEGIMLICPICKTKVREESYTETYTSPFNNQEYKKYECPNCDVHWWEPLKIIPEFYESEVFESYISFHEGIRSRIAYHHQPFFIHFPKNIEEKLLDIGCGDGVFLKEAQKYGFEVWGIDFDSKSVEAAKKHLGVDTIYPMSLEEFYEYVKENNLSFDVITFFEVLEHQDKPKEFLKMVKELLREGGYIAGSVPNRESIFQVELHQQIHHWIDNPPHHFLRFSKKALENTLKSAGFSNVEVYTTDFPKELLPAYIEKKLLGEKLDRIKVWLKGRILRNQRLANTLTVEDIERVNPSSKAKILKSIKKLRNLLFEPVVLFYLKKLKRNGLNLYFQARKF